MPTNPKVFISYAWDSDDHKDWVRTVADRLIEEGVETILDQYDCPPGTNFLHLMEQAVNNADRILIILSEKYKAKADGREKGVGYEGMVISAEIYEDGLSTKYIPSLRLGDHASTTPIFLKGRAFLDFRRDEDFETQFEILLKTIFEHSDKPVLGQAPDFGAKTKTPKSPTRTSKISVSALPELQPHFTGREKELDLLDAAWADPNANIVQFIAPGGTGKTTLVTYWLENRMPKDSADIYAWSFYSQGTDDRKQSSSDLFFQRTLNFFGESEMPTDSRERGRLLANALRKNRCLLILDGIEPLQHPPGPLEGELKDPALKALFRELSFEQPGLCILTTRIAVKELEGKGEPQHLRRDLEDLGEIAGAELLRSIGVKGSDKELRAAAFEYRGHALALRLLGNYLTDLLDGDVRQRDRIPHLTDDDRAGKHARRVMEAYVAWFETQTNWKPGFFDKLLGKKPPVSPEVAFLQLLGLFDRPAPIAALDALLEEPNIRGLTDGLRELPPERISKALNHLKKLGLLSEKLLFSGALPKELHQLTALRHLESLDAHPLVREHFGQRLETNNPTAWRAANARLYDYYRNLPGKHLPDTIEEMEPLFLAMAHGCRAEKQQKVLEMYWERVKRKNEHYSTAKLGALGSDLTALSHLFERVWGRPSRNMTEHDQASVLGWAGFRLRGLGRLREAVEPMNEGLERRIQQKNWLEGAKDSTNLSELFLTLGKLPEAVEYGRLSVEYADRSKDNFLKEMSRTTHATALYQFGNLETARQLFAETEAMQQKSQPEFRYLYSLRGYKYCELLLDLKDWEDVLKRASVTVEWSKQRNLLLDIALDQLSLGRGHFGKAQTEKTANPETGQWLNSAVGGLRKAGTLNMLPLALLARAAWHRYEGRYTKAHTDLQETLEIAESGSMGLYLVDYHIEMARLLKAAGSELPESFQLSGSWTWEQHKTEALRRIKETGYLRRLKETEEL